MKMQGDIPYSTFRFTPGRKFNFPIVLDFGYDYEDDDEDD